MIEYKFKEITRDGLNTKVKIVLHEGAYEDVAYTDMTTGEAKIEERFVRAKTPLEEREYELARDMNREQLVSFFNEEVVRIKNEKYPDQDVILIQI